MYNTKNCKMTTPWGTSDYKICYERGIFRINTPGHGGIAFSKGKAEKLLSKQAIDIGGYRMGGYVFFEEDCAVCVAMLDSDILLTHLANSHAAYGSTRSKQDLLGEALKSVEKYFPEYYKYYLTAKGAK